MRMAPAERLPPTIEVVIAPKPSLGLTRRRSIGKLRLSTALEHSRDFLLPIIARLTR